MGVPTREFADRTKFETTLRMTQGCATVAVEDVSGVWLYLKDWRKDVVVAFDKEGRVLCADHGGMSTVSR